MTRNQTACLRTPPQPLTKLSAGGQTVFISGSLGNEIPHACGSVTDYVTNQEGK